MVSDKRGLFVDGTVELNIQQRAGKYAGMSFLLCYGGVFLIFVTQWIPRVSLLLASTSVILWKNAYFAAPSACRPVMHILYVSSGVADAVVLCYQPCMVDEEIIGRDNQASTVSFCTACFITPLTGIDLSSPTLIGVTI